MRIKRIDNEDYFPLSSFFRRNNLPIVSRFFSPFPLIDETAKEITTKPHFDLYYAAYFENEIIGFSMLRGWDEGFEIPSFGILIDNQHQNLGYGKQLTQFTIEEARRIGVKKVRLSVNERNSRAIQLYLSLDFKEITRQEVVNNGEIEVKIIMIKEFHDENYAE